MNRWRRRIFAIAVGVILAVGVAFAARQIWRVHEPDRFQPGDPPVRVPVEVVTELKRIGPDDFPKGKRGELQTFHTVDWSKKDSNKVRFSIGLTTGFTGYGAHVLLDTRTRTSLADGYCLQDYGPPFEMGWTNLSGVVRIVDWNVTPASLVEVELRGELDGKQYDLHLCRALGDEAR
jgi:hypothetical protein